MDVYLDAIEGRPDQPVAGSDSDPDEVACGTAVERGEPENGS